MNGMDTILELDPVTAAAVKHLAENLGVSRAEAVRRAVQSADLQRHELTAPEKLQALDALCRSLDLDDEKAARWKAAVQDARR
jgi:hypothetical protein